PAPRAGVRAVGPGELERCTCPTPGRERSKRPGDDVLEGASPLEARIWLLTSESLPANVLVFAPRPGPRPGRPCPLATAPPPAGMATSWLPPGGDARPAGGCRGVYRRRGGRTEGPDGRSGPRQTETSTARMSPGFRGRGQSSGKS